MARYLGQMELLPLPAPQRVPFQLQLPLISGFWWGLVVCPKKLAERHLPAPATGSGLRNSYNAHDTIP
jgi:hypothetical protein